MPELPEVEVARRHLTRALKGCRVTAIDIRDPRRIDGEASLLVDRTCLGWRRHGKLLLGRFEGGFGMLSHLGMTGKWVTDASERRHRRIVVSATGGSNSGSVAVTLIDPRRFGKTWFGAEQELVALDAWAKLGLDALDVVQRPDAAARLRAVYGHKPTPLKRRLLEQSGVAGFGNITVVEACWRAQVHPHAPCSSLTEPDWGRLALGALEHFRQVIEVEGAQELAYVSERRAANPFLVYGRAGSPCPRCETPLSAGALSKRPSVWCQRCQGDDPVRRSLTKVSS